MSLFSGMDLVNLVKRQVFVNLIYYYPIATYIMQTNAEQYIKTRSLHEYQTRQPGMQSNIVPYENYVIHHCIGYPSHEYIVYVKHNDILKCIIGYMPYNDNTGITTHHRSVVALFITKPLGRLSISSLSTVQQYTKISATPNLNINLTVLKLHIKGPLKDIIRDICPDRFVSILDGCGEKAVRVFQDQFINRSIIFISTVNMYCIEMSMLKGYERYQVHKELFFHGLHQIIVPPYMFTKFSTGKNIIILEKLSICMYEYSVERSLSGITHYILGCAHKMKLSCSTSHTGIKIQFCKEGNRGIMREPCIKIAFDLMVRSECWSVLYIIW